MVTCVFRLDSVEVSREDAATPLIMLDRCEAVHLQPVRSAEEWQGRRLGKVSKELHRRVGAPVIGPRERVPQRRASRRLGLRVGDDVARRRPSFT